jgi:hypothetical protein
MSAGTSRPTHREKTLAQLNTPHSIDSEQTSRWGSFEPFVDERAVAAFLQITPRRVLELARNGVIPSHPIGCVRKTWRFRISEIDAYFRSRADVRQSVTMPSAVPATRGRKRNG